MDGLTGAHYFSLPTQGNVYCLSTLTLSCGQQKALVATLKRKVYCFEFTEESAFLLPIVKEVPFTYIPSGAEILSIDAFNRSQTHDDFFVGITIIKVNGGQSSETYLNIYTEQVVEDRSELNLDSLAQNCLILELPFIPFQLYHTTLSRANKSHEVVWLLSGSDLKVHLYREDPLNHTYCEVEGNEVFPEFLNLPSVVLWMDIRHTSDSLKRLTAYGCECGTLKFQLVDVLSNSVIMDLIKHFDAPLSRVLLFKLREENKPLLLKYSEKLRDTSVNENDSSSHFNLLAINTLQTSVVFMNVLDEQFNRSIDLPESDKFDSAICGFVADINMDCISEVIVGTYSKLILVYVYENGAWILRSQQKLPHSVQSIAYIDLTDDGVKELFVTTSLGVAIFQHNLQPVLEKFKKRMNQLEICP